MKRVMAILGCLVLAVALHAEPPTQQQILDAAREAAREDGTRETLADVAEYAARYDPEHALEDFLAAADAPRGQAHGIFGVWRIDREIVDGLIEHGRRDRARELLVEALPTVLTTYGVPRNSEALERARVAAEMALRLWPERQALVHDAIEQIAALIETARDDRHRHLAMQRFGKLLAVVDPQNAPEVAGALSDRDRSAQEYLRRIEADPLDVLDELDALTGGNDFNEPFRGAWKVRYALVAALMKVDPAKAMETAFHFRLHQVNGPGHDGMRRPIVDAVLDLGVEALPMREEWEGYVRALCGYIAEVDHPAAMILAGRLLSPKQQGRALWSIAVTAARAGRLDDAQDAARRLIVMHDAGEAVEPSSLSATARELAENDGGLVGELLARVREAEDWRHTWLTWWEVDPDAAEQWLEEKSEDEQFEARAGTVWRIALASRRDAALAKARELMASPQFVADPYGGGLPWMLARLDVETAHEAWQKLPRLDPATAAEDGVARVLRALLDIAERVQKREPDGAGPEIAEIERILGAMPEIPESFIRIRARFSAVLAPHDPQRAKTIALDVLDSDAADANPNVLAEVQRNATRGLARSDPEAALALLQNRDDLRRQWEIRATGIAAVAETDADSAFKMVDLLRANTDRSIILQRVVGQLGKGGRPEALGAFMERWMADAERPEDAVLAAMRELVGSASEGFSSVVIDLLDRISSDRKFAHDIHRVGFPNYAGASDEFLAYLHGRIAGSDAEPAIESVTAARIARDWELRGELLGPLTPARRVEVLLRADHLCRQYRYPSL